MTFDLQLDAGKEPSHAQHLPLWVPAGLELAKPCRASALSHFWQRKAIAALTNHGLCVCSAGLGEAGAGGTMAVERPLAGRNLSQPSQGSCTSAP